MKKIISLLALALSFSLLLISCGSISDGAASYEENVSIYYDGSKEFSSTGFNTVKDKDTPFYVRLNAGRTAVATYNASEEVVLVAYVGSCDLRLDDFANDEYKLVFYTSDGSKICNNNEYKLIGLTTDERYRFSEYYLSHLPLVDTDGDGLDGLWELLPVRIEFRVPAAAFKDGSGVIKAEIVPIDLEKDEVKAYQADIYYAKDGDMIRFNLTSE
ncbi:MAG: hypothetical protein E7608_06680 [Ruminococcaceae bacterium]|nr:hypothetical protein [Oscillospiraceae bacterium]